LALSQEEGFGMARELTANLMLHCGGHQLEYEELQMIKTPEPEGIWNPIAHTTIFQTMMDTLNGSGYQIKQAVHAVSAKGANYFGLVQVDADYLETDEYGLVVGFRNSHNKSFSASMVAGAQVFVCDNLAFSGEISFKHKHTTNVMDKLPGLFREGVGKLNNMYLNQEVRYEAYKQHELEDNRVEKLIIDMFRQNFINAPEIGKIVNVYDTPTHEEYGEGTAWTLFNSATEVLRGKLGRLPKSTMGFHSILDGECTEELNEQAQVHQQQHVGDTPVAGGQAA
jgi:hypothetical protein